MMRDMTIEDIPAIIAAGLAMADESPVYRDQAMDPIYTGKYLNAAWGAGLLVGIIDPDYDALIFGSVSSPWSSPTPQASEWMLYIPPEHRGLGLATHIVREFIRSVRACGARKLYVGSSTGINDEGVRKLYEFMGFTSVGSSLVKEI